MRCGACNTKLTREADEYIDGKAGWWICRKCNVTHELEPYDVPETAEEQEEWDQRFKGKIFFRRLDWILDDMSREESSK